MENTYNLSEADQLDLLKRFYSIIKDDPEPELFMLECFTQDCIIAASREFFDDILFPFLFNSYVKGEWLKIKVKLNKKIKTLNSIYQALKNEKSFNQVA